MLLYLCPPEFPLNSSSERTLGNLRGLKFTYRKYRMVVAPETLKGTNDTSRQPICDAMISGKKSIFFGKFIMDIFHICDDNIFQTEYFCSIILIEHSRFSLPLICGNFIVTDFFSMLNSFLRGLAFSLTPTFIIELDY